MKTFSERNPVPIGVVGISVLVVVFALVLSVDRLPLVHRGVERSALFAEAGGLEEGNEVRVAGVRVGEVTGIALEGASVRVTFRVGDTWIGDQSTAAIKIKTLLGQKYLAIDPQGTHELDAGRAIPLERTTTPIDVTAAFSDLATTVTQIDTTQLERSFRVLADTFAGTPAAVRGTIDGLTRLSHTISSRDDELATLLRHTAQLSGTLAEHREDVGLLVTDGNELLGELAARRRAVRQVLIGTRQLSVQLSGLVDDNQRRLAPALDDLDRVTQVLQRNQDHLEESLRLLAPYYRLLTAALGNGHWVDTYLCGLFGAGAVPVLDDDVVRDCRPGGDP